MGDPPNSYTSIAAQKVHYALAKETPSIEGLSTVSDLLPLPHMDEDSAIANSDSSRPADDPDHRAPRCQGWMLMNCVTLLPRTH